MELEPEGERTKKLPAVVPYLLVPDAPAMIAFLEAGFGANLRFRAPAPDGRTMHAEITLGDSVVMLSDASHVTPAQMNLAHYVQDTDATYQRALSAGAASLSEPATQNYGDRVAGIKDPAGNTWWICAPG
jgi:uncharacterized glyoxalase superfamily protein PhnB